MAGFYDLMSLIARWWCAGEEVEVSPPSKALTAAFTTARSTRARFE